MRTMIIKTENPNAFGFIWFPFIFLKILCNLLVELKERYSRKSWDSLFGKLSEKLRKIEFHVPCHIDSLFYIISKITISLTLII